MSKDSLDNDYEYQNRVNDVRLKLFDSLKRVKLSAACGGWDGYEEKQALLALEEGLELLNEWRERNAINEEPDLAITPEGYIAVDKTDLSMVLGEAQREGGRIPSRQEIVEEMFEQLEEEDE